MVIISLKRRNNNIQRTKDPQHLAPSPWIPAGQYGMGQTVGFESQSFQKPVCGTELLEKVFTGKRRNQHVTFYPGKKPSWHCMGSNRHIQLFL